ncbi:MAG: HAD family hydrolase [wastewater metagenome]|nr:HAD family hydrolase [Candidatus Loosdrechtia aerotolerans]
MKYKLVIFDFDGTLANTIPWFTSALNTVAVRYRFKPINQTDIERLRGLHAKDIMKYLGIPLWKAPLITAHLRTLLAKNLHQVSLFEDVDMLLEMLARKGIRLALISSNSEDNVRHILGPANEALITDYECGVSIFGKTAKLRKVLRSSGIAKHEAILIGDELRDGESAQRVHIAFGAVTWGCNSRDSLTASKPEVMFTRIGEILEYIL